MTVCCMYKYILCVLFIRSVYICEYNCTERRYIIINNNTTSVEEVNMKYDTCTSYFSTAFLNNLTSILLQTCIKYLFFNSKKHLTHIQFIVQTYISFFHSSVYA